MNRFPDSEAWLTISDPAARLRVGLGDLYGYYRVNARLVGNILCDMPMFADVGGTEAFDDRMGQIFATLTEGWKVGEAVPLRLRTAIGDAKVFETWRSLTEHGVTDDQARDMMVAFVVAIADPAGGAPSR